MTPIGKIAVLAGMGSLGMALFTKSLLRIIMKYPNAHWFDSAAIGVGQALMWLALGLLIREGR